MISVDRLIGEFDRALRAVAGVAHAIRPSPAASVSERKSPTKGACMPRR